MFSKLYRTLQNLTTFYKTKSKTLQRLYTHFQNYYKIALNFTNGNICFWQTYTQLYKSLTKLYETFPQLYKTLHIFKLRKSLQNLTKNFTSLENFTTLFFQTFTQQKNKNLKECNSSFTNTLQHFTKLYTSLHKSKQASQNIATFYTTFHNYTHIFKTSQQQTDKTLQ